MSILTNGLYMYLLKLESPSPIDALCQVWVKLVHSYWRLRQCIFTNYNLVLSSFGKGRNLYIFEQN